MSNKPVVQDEPEIEEEIDEVTAEDTAEDIAEVIIEAGEVLIKFDEDRAAKFASPKAARSFLRSRGLSVKDFVKADGVWVPSATITDLIADLDLTIRQRPEESPEDAEQKAAKLEAITAARQAAKAEKAAAAAQAKADKQAKRQAQIEEKAAAEAAKETWDALTTEDICPDFGMKVADAEAAINGDLKQADVYDILMDGDWPEEMPVSRRQKIAKKLAREYISQ